MAIENEGKKRKRIASKPPQRRNDKTTEAQEPSNGGVVDPRTLVAGVTGPPIYHFYEIVANNAEGNGQPGDKHYRCYHENEGITKWYEHTHFPEMFRLYQTIKCHQDQRPTVEEIQFAANKIPLNSKTAQEYLRTLEVNQGPLCAAFSHQVAKNEVPWDQSKFEQLLVEWQVACDQPFDEVEKPEFKALMHHTHHSSAPLHIPSATAVKRCVMKMGESTVDTMKQFIMDLAGKELVGEHSGENMALSVWKTLELYDLKGRIQDIVADNASNNDTMMESLAALKLLEGLGAFTASQRRGAERSNYQDMVTLPVNRESDADIVTQEDDLEEDDDNMGPVLSAVAKIRKIVHAATNQERDEIAKMLILDVKTCWSSTHQMLRATLHPPSTLLLGAFMLLHQNQA
ncbi:hypothetical protein JB92DRAFT_3105577 [Gautieria morchelliformis]|nr:hypothetical protein JB92DRAFT_3105577 [Gautieria morchelliformis]